MRLEPHEFKQCLVSLGYNLKEGDKVCYLSRTIECLFVYQTRAMECCILVSPN